MRSSPADQMADAAAALAARGDGDAFATLCHLLQDDVWRYCLAILGDAELAEEAAQETFVRAVRAIRRFRGDAPARVYLLVLARRSCSTVLRREARHRGHDRLDAAGTAEPAVASGGGHVELGMLLDDLPEDLRQAFVLTQVLGLPYDHAAQVAGSPVGTIRSRVFRARERLVASLLPIEEEDIDVR